MIVYIENTIESTKTIINEFNEVSIQKLFIVLYTSNEQFEN